MSTEAHKFKVGLFVIGSVVIAAGALIWLGASKFLSETRRYVTYFDESVQGLDIGSQVKFMGVAVGGVSDIHVAPDGKLVQVDMELGSDFTRDDDMRAQLAMAGITGMKFVEIMRAPEAEPLEIGFKPPAEYIPAKASSAAEIFEAIGKVYDKVMQVDFAGISDEVKGSFHSISERMDDEKIDRLLEATAGAGERLRYLLEKKQTENVIEEMDATIGELKGLVASIRQEIEGMKLKDTFAQLSATIENFNMMLERMDNELAGTLINVRRTTDNLARITEKISQDPAQTLLGEPPPERIVPVIGRGGEGAQ
ncbi:MAG: MlaD family protein [Deltaproteobacteria bacterium]|nr:MlaD family protein [Deltaproteobacteria bacterium]